MAKYNYYAVLKGHQPGIYATWDECEKNVRGFKGAQYKGFVVKEEAEDYFNNSKKREFIDSEYIYTQDIGARTLSVGELVEILKKVDPHKTVWTVNDNGDILDITDIKVSDKKIFLCLF